MGFASMVKLVEGARYEHHHEQVAIIYLATYRVVDVYRLLLQNLAIGKRCDKCCALLRIATNPNMDAAGTFREEPHEVEKRHLQACAAPNQLRFA